MFPNIGCNWKVTKLILRTLQLSVIDSIEHGIKKCNMAPIALVEPAGPPLYMQNILAPNIYRTKGMIWKCKLFQ